MNTTAPSASTTAAVVSGVPGGPIVGPSGPHEGPMQSSSNLTSSRSSRSVQMVGGGGGTGGDITPGNRAGANPSHRMPQQQHHHQHGHVQNAVTPNTHASSSYEEEQPHYGGSYHGAPPPPPHSNSHPPKPHKNHYSEPYGSSHSYPPHLPAIEKGREHVERERERERESYYEGYNHYNGGYDYGYSQQGPPVSANSNPPPHPSSRDSEWTYHSRQVGGYSDQDRERFEYHSKQGGPPNSGSYYYPEDSHGPPPGPPHPTPYARAYRNVGERDRDDGYYGQYPEQDRDSYAPPPPPPSYENGDSPYMQHKSPYLYSNGHRPPNDQVIFRNNYQENPNPQLHPTHSASRSDEIHSYVTAEEGPPRYPRDGPPPRQDEYHLPPKPLYDAARYEDAPPPDVVHMVSPHRRGRIQPNHHRQFSNGSDMSHYDPRPPPPPNHYQYNPHSYPPTSPMRRPHHPGHHPHHPPYSTYSSQALPHHLPPHHAHPHHHPPHPIPLTLTSSHSFESSHRSTPPPVPQATHPTCQSISEVNSNDVLCGRGGGTNSQIGNRRFRKLVQEYQPDYLVARRKSKPHISKTIVQIVRKRGGRFLKKEESTGCLFEVGDERAEAKTSQALREGLDVRACAGKKKDDLEGHGRETPVVTNTQGKKREREEKEEEEEEEVDSFKKNSSEEEEDSGDNEFQEDFSPPRAKMKLEDEPITSTTEEDAVSPPPVDAVPVDAPSKEENSKKDEISKKEEVVVVNKEEELWPSTAV